MKLCVCEGVERNELFVQIESSHIKQTRICIRGARWPTKPYYISHCRLHLRK